MTNRVIKTMALLALTTMLLAGATAIWPIQALAGSEACAPNPLSGSIEADVTLCLANSPYTFNGDVMVAEGVTLTIEAGTVIEVRTPIRGGGKITVHGTLDAEGTALNPIVFTSGWATPGEADWENIVFSASSSGNVLEYVTVEYGGFFDPAVDIQTSALTMRNSTIRLNGVQGMRVHNASPTIEDTTFSDNVEGALWLEGASFPQLSGLGASGNGFDGVIIDGTTITMDYTWGDGGLVSYRQVTDVTVSENVTLTITPGTSVEIRSPVQGAGQLTVDGRLIARGNAANPIYFTSGWDTPGEADWDGITFSASSNGSILEYVTVAYGGSTEAAVEIATSSLTIRYSTITRSGADGIQVTAGTPTITHNNITENDGYGLRNTQTTGFVTAICNWWEAASGPTYPSNPDGTGQQVSQRVFFDPWLVAPAPDGACTGTYPHVYLPLVIR